MIAVLAELSQSFAVAQPTQLQSRLRWQSGQDEKPVTRQGSLYLQRQVCSLFFSHQTSNQIETDSTGSDESRCQDRADGWIFQVLDDSSLHPTFTPSPAFAQPMIEHSNTMRLQNSEHRPHLVAIRLGNSHGSPIRNEECTRKEDLKHVIYELLYTYSNGRRSGTLRRKSRQISNRKSFRLRTDGESGRESSPQTIGCLQQAEEA